MTTPTPAWRGILANVVTAATTAGLALTLVYLFYSSALRQRAEHKLFDLRVRMAPDFPPPEASSAVGLITIDQDSIDTLVTDTDRVSGTMAAKARDLDAAGLLAVVRATLALNPSQLAVLLPPQIYPYSGPAVDALARLADSEPRLHLGTFDLSLRDQGLANLPLPMQRLLARGQLLKADLVRDYRRDIIRTLVRRQEREIPFLAAALADKFPASAPPSLLNGAGPEAKPAPRSDTASELSYIHPRHFLTATAAQVVAGRVPAALFAGRMVLIGYTAYRPWTFRDREATHANTPWQAEGEDVEHGLPVLTLQAMGFINALTDGWLKPSTVWINAAQTVLLTILAFGSWQFGIAFASTALLGGWVLLTYLHACAFAWLHLHVPMADTMLWTCLAAVAGASLRLRHEGRLRAEQEAHVQADRALAETQDRFLTRLAIELAAINGRIVEIMRGLMPLVPSEGPALTAYLKARGSSEELADYLDGIRQFVSLRERELVKPTLAPLDLEALLAGVLKQFESRLHDAQLTVNIDLAPGLKAQGAATLVTQILYNLISNAVKYAPPGSAIDVTAAYQHGLVRVSVRDYGAGIAPEFHDRIFEKFYRVKDDMVYKHKGHGLGLYLSRFFAAQMGASLTVESQPGQGATFILTLRAAPA